MSKRANKGKSRHPPAVEVTKEKMTKITICQFCHQGETKDILQSGRLYKLTQGKFTEYYHYFCLLFSSHGIQRGKDDEGINGFLYDDIKKEVKRGEGIKCNICSKPGATITCQRKSCEQKYHFTCGATTIPEYTFVFRNNMDSYCHEHAPRQNRLARMVVRDSTCMVCLDNNFTSPGPGPGRLVSPCCGRTFHRDCVQKTALQAGKAALKCPACNTKEKFNEEMERCGVYIPHADAQWEMPENSNFYQFDDMLAMYRRCDAETCSCPRGREDSRTGTKYEVIKCETCGQSGVHIACGGLEISEPVFICQTCQPETAKEDSSDLTDSDEEDEVLRERLLRHEEKRLRLIAERNRLVREEQERLGETKRQEEWRIRQIKDFLSSGEERDPDPDIIYVGSQRGVPVKITTPSGECMSVGPYVNKWREGGHNLQSHRSSGDRPAPQRTAILMPRKVMAAPVVSGVSVNIVPAKNNASIVPENTTEKHKNVNLVENDGSSKLKISQVFSGDIVGRLEKEQEVVDDTTESELRLELDSDTEVEVDSDSDIEILEDSATKKARLLHDQIVRVLHNA